MLVKNLALVPEVDDLVSMSELTRVAAALQKQGSQRPHICPNAAICQSHLLPNLQPKEVAVLAAGSRHSLVIGPEGGLSLGGARAESARAGVAEQTGRVVGLHHWGIPTGSLEPVNQGVHIGQVLTDLSTRVPALHAEITGNTP